MWGLVSHEVPVPSTRGRIVGVAVATFLVAVGISVVTLVGWWLYSTTSNVDGDPPFWVWIPVFVAIGAIVVVQLVKPAAQTDLRTRLLERGAPTFAVVTKVVGPVKDGAQTEIRFCFQVGERIYRGQVWASGRETDAGMPRADDRLSILYDRSDPQVCMVVGVKRDQESSTVASDATASPQ